MGAGAPLVIIMMFVATLWCARAVWNEFTGPYIGVAGLLCLLTFTIPGLIAAGFIAIAGIWAWLETPPAPREAKPAPAPKPQGVPWDGPIYETNVGELNRFGCEGTVKIPAGRDNPKEHFERVIAKMGWPIVSRESTVVTMKVVTNKASWEGETITCSWTMDNDFVTYKVHSVSNTGLLDQVNSWNVKKMLGQFESA